MASNASKALESTVVSTLTRDGFPTEAQIRDLATQLRAIPVYEVSDEEFEDVIRRIHSALQITMDLGAVVAEEHVPWLAGRKAEIDPYYWKRYADYLRQQNWPPKVLNTLDTVTDEILDRLGNPAADRGWPRKGLVMGDVQSGKTSNYTGLICKAADAGYRLVVLLTGTLESLRRQTQSRLDAGFVGVDSSGVVAKDKKKRQVGVGRIDGTRAAGVFTSTLTDFNSKTITQLGFKLAAFNEPVLVVVKKHKRVLENLAAWLETHNADQHGRIDAPMLLIDDEADNASVNTRGENSPTAINAAIRRLLHVFTRSSYVGFTATPFANVFIDPDTEKEMIGDDLFPRDFIYALDAPSNYVGAAAVFDEDSPLDLLRSIGDADATFPKAHKSTLQVTALPGSLSDALAAFLVANAVLDLRGSGPRHRSMLINVSHYTDVQERVRDLLIADLKDLQEGIRSYSKLSQHEALEDARIRRLKAVFDDEYASTSGCNWPQVQAALLQAAAPVEVRAVNRRSGAAALDYMAYQESGLRVVAVGGNSLSRGLTLEGLCVSYFFRRTQMYDALLQMGRWFGYRDGYIDLCRVWASDETQGWYSHIANAAAELRHEVRRMQTLRLPPSEFGLRVRAHPDSLLLITARNKMKASHAVEHGVSVDRASLETYRLLNDHAAIAENAAAAQALIQALMTLGLEPEESDSKAVVWRGVPRHLIVQLLRRFRSHPLNLAFQPAALADFIEQGAADELNEWDVGVPSGNSSVKVALGSRSVSLQKRRLLVEKARRSLLVSERRMRVGSRGVEKLGMDEADVEAAQKDFEEDESNRGKHISDAYYRARRKRPLLLLHFIEGEIQIEDGDDLPKKSVKFDSGEADLCALGLSFPQIVHGERRVRYYVNEVEWRNLMGEDFEDADDEDDGDAEP